MRVRRMVAGPLAWTVSVVFVLVLLLAVARLVPDYPLIALGVAVAVLLLGMTVVDPTIVPLLSMPLVLVVTRVGAGGIDLSVSDVVLFGAFWPAVVLGPRPYTPPMRWLLWLTVLYQVATSFTVIANPYSANLVEWFHAWFLTGGTLIVGWSLGRAGRGAQALTILLLASAVIAGFTIAEGLAHLAEGQGLEPVYPQLPFPMHKNFAGPVLGFAALLAYIHPPWMRWRRSLALAAFWLCSLGLVFTQSRQAIVGLAVALAVVVMRSDDSRRRSKLIILAGVAGLAFVGGIVRDQVQSGNQFNAVFQRLTWLQDSVTVWMSDPIFGAGLRWWYTTRFDARFQPPNAEMEVLTTAGVVGLAAFLVLMVGAVLILWRLPSTYGLLGATVVLSRFIQGQFDLFWVAVLVSVPFLVAGICLGAAARAEAEQDEATPGVPGGRALATAGLAGP